jgi:hypothetical protein
MGFKPRMAVSRAGRRLCFVVIIINPAPGLEMLITGIGQTLQHGFRTLGRVQRHVGINRAGTLAIAGNTGCYTICIGLACALWDGTASLLLCAAVGRGFGSLALTTAFFAAWAILTLQRTPKLVDICIGIPFTRSTNATGIAARVSHAVLEVLAFVAVAVALVVKISAAMTVVVARSAAVSVSVTAASTPTAEPVLIPAIVIELVLVAIITLIVSCLEARVKRAIITIAHARSAWMIVIILADIP